MDTEETQVSAPSDSVSALFVLGWFMFMVLFVFTTTWMHFQVYTPTDVPYDLKPISSEFLKQLGGEPSVVKIGLILEHYHIFRLSDNKFDFTGTLWFYFDPSELSLPTIEGITLDNGKFLERSKPYVQFIGDALFVRYAVHIEFQSHMDFSDFPDDDHRLYLVFTHPGLSPGSLIFESTRNDLVVLDDVAREGWYEFNHTAQTGYFETRIQSASIDLKLPHPAVVFGIEYRRNSMRDWISILLPLMIMLAVALFVFVMDRIRYWKMRIEVTLQIIVGAVAFRFVMESMSPKVGYLMISDMIFFIFIGIFAFLFLASLVAPRLNKNIERGLIVFVNLTVMIATYLLWGYFNV